MFNTLLYIAIWVVANLFIMFGLVTKSLKNGGKNMLTFFLSGGNMPNFVLSSLQY